MSNISIEQKPFLQGYNHSSFPIWGVTALHIVKSMKEPQRKNIAPYRAKTTSCLDLLVSMKKRENISILSIFGTFFSISKCVCMMNMSTKLFIIGSMVVPQIQMTQAIFVPDAICKLFIYCGISARSWDYLSDKRIKTRKDGSKITFEEYFSRNSKEILDINRNSQSVSMSFPHHHSKFTT